MSDEFIIEEEESSSPFLLVFAILASIFILAVLCIGSFFFLNRANGNGGDGDPARATRLAENAAIATENAFVTLTVSAMETRAAQPTATATATETPTTAPTATETAVPTETAVVQPPDGTGEPTDGLEGDGSPTPIILGSTNIIGTPTPIAIVGGGAGGTGTLPQTGISAWAAAALGLLFIVLLGTMRRLRSRPS